MRASRAIAVLSFVALAGILSATSSCTQESIILANVPATDAGAPAIPQPCVLPTDCAAGSFCSKTACSDAAGTCQPLPVVCGALDPVCGCDSITYYNDCIRQQFSIAASTPGECFKQQNPCSSDGTVACPDPTTQSCAVIFGGKGPCPPNIMGTCWVIPQPCPAAPDGTDLWDTCDQSEHCADTCIAISTGTPFRRSPMCPVMPAGN